MRWVTARELEQWAQSIGARDALPKIVSDLILASSLDITAIRFPSCDKGQVRGCDGVLISQVEGLNVPHSTINVNGTIYGPLTSNTCTYSVNPDGTGKSVAEFSGAPFNGPATVAFVIVDHNREIRFLNTNSVVAGFTARRQ